MLCAYIITDIRLQQGFMWDKKMLMVRRETKSVWITVKRFNNGPQKEDKLCLLTCSVSLIEIAIIIIIVYLEPMSSKHLSTPDNRQTASPRMTIHSTKSLLEVDDYYYYMPKFFTKVLSRLISVCLWQSSRVSQLFSDSIVQT